MRLLYHVPIIHAITDYGSLASSFEAAWTRDVGQDVFQKKQKQIEDFWRLAENKINRLINDFSGAIIYQDSFPVGSREKLSKFFELMIVDQPKSPNFQLIQKLLKKGAILEGTEDRNLIVEQVEIYKAIARAATPEEQRVVLIETEERSIEITKLRDQFIARRIYGTLPKNGRGLIFIGRAHDVVSELKKLNNLGKDKIRIICL
ncbi:MAG: hypothetical protein CO002_03875 [Candidatus Portnoybacteria bacterium CG_4_8_14_3_um_filter_44_10]|uniref:Uncharacterized protein n=5 Tax=Candidatus Portnoyibacteriota TaxID=1817913 RepID=A0A2H0KQ86_9BACT|nr:MAG: hypothetical protein AUK17_01700 [Parcubacteria group bacterium CG2_30_44_18]PIQ74306.1 MAG: hypothetical protein COV85_02825 [Candidatus Portnoybacteria bacterium CG11_big_fil_rev_8_21_14_0_20_44_10]PIS16481.1 MAG: hypothetical protein COT61_03670 [Candidatus Portnoybacteria bacterium CG09_land_8_20_14_0_10_44_13]PIW75109.1 MAG: hypothetical protein CO002_03875 [Candidatus Portnoybacteria bacterium CG_4_8_14_3_um_filter_44_10]PIZ71856.1 MAG: hypothetical protein COY11_00755 [Candidatus